MGSHTIRGIVTVLNTPFLDGGAIDIDGLRTHVAYARAAGVVGFLVNGLAGEVEFLFPPERKTVASAVVNEARGTPVIAGLGAASDPTVLAAAERFLSLGCAGLLVNGAQAGEEELARTLTRLDGLKPRILMLQDWDADGAGIPVDTLLRLVDLVPSLHWLKIEVASAGPKYSELIERGPSHLRVAGGWAVREMIDGLERGVHAFMPTALHRTYVRIYTLFESGRRDEARAHFDRLRPILDFSNQRLDVSIAFFKRLLRAQGIYETHCCRMPSAILTSVQEREADRFVTLAKELESVD